MHRYELEFKLKGFKNDFPSMSFLDFRSIPPVEHKRVGSRETKDAENDDNDR